MILLPKHYGTCYGANCAIEKALHANEFFPNKKIVIYKEILHNKRVIYDLEKNGIFCIDDLNELNKDNAVVIRAHGEGKLTYDVLNEMGIDIIDATCPNVLKIHNIIADRYAKDYSIIIIGKKISENKFHPEVEGSNGWCDNNAIIIDTIEDINNIKKLKDNILIICQTTANEKKVLEYTSIIKGRFKDKNIEFINTICNAQKLIQESSIEIAKIVDIMFIIGGKNSSNTHELYKKCNQFCKSIKVSTIDELQKELLMLNIESKTKIGITGGASTPQYEIEEFKKIIEEYQEKS